ncbi:MAG: pyridoxamine 5'-phosphate oxidase family protein [Verrucomicrobia bacterium]|nr:pyridoxamine 5'-phosphate oxidase family protein [Verrucomicrobiota bacterium]
MNTNPSTDAEQRLHFHRLLKGFGTAMLATRATDGGIHVRPMAIAHFEDCGRFWFFTGADTLKTYEIEADSRVQLIFQDDGSAYVTARGRAELSTDRALIAQYWKEPFRAWFPGGQDDPNLQLISVLPEEGEYWDNQGLQGVKYLFEAARAYVTGSTPRVDAGIHAAVKL